MLMHAINTRTELQYEEMNAYAAPTFQTTFLQMSSTTLTKVYISMSIYVCTLQKLLDVSVISNQREVGCPTLVPLCRLPPRGQSVLSRNGHQAPARMTTAFRQCHSHHPPPEV